MTTRRLVKAVIGVLAIAVMLAGAPTTASADLNASHAQVEFDAGFSIPSYCVGERYGRIVFHVHDGELQSQDRVYQCEEFDVWVNFSASDFDPTNGRRPTRINLVMTVRVYDYMSGVPQLCANESRGFVDDADALQYMNSRIDVSCPGLMFSLNSSRVYPPPWLAHFWDRR